MPIRIAAGFSTPRPPGRPARRRCRCRGRQRGSVAPQVGSKLRRWRRRAHHDAVVDRQGGESCPIASCSPAASRAAASRLNRCRRGARRAARGGPLGAVGRQPAAVAVPRLHAEAIRRNSRRPRAPCGAPTRRRRADAIVPAPRRQRLSRAPRELPADRLGVDDEEPPRLQVAADGAQRAASSSASSASAGTGSGVKLRHEKRRVNSSRSGTTLLPGGRRRRHGARAGATDATSTRPAALHGPPLPAAAARTCGAPAGLEGEAWRTARIRIGISSCLLGCKVRLRRGTKGRLPGRHVRSLGRVGAGVSGGRGRHGTPRESIRLVREAARCACWPKSGRHWTASDARVLGASHRRARDRRLVRLRPQKDSPRAAWAVQGPQPRRDARKDGRGVFARRCSNGSRTAVGGGGALCDRTLRDNFRRAGVRLPPLRSLFAGAGRSAAGRLPHAHKLQLLATRRRRTRRRRLVAGAKALARDELRRRYEDLFMQGLKRSRPPAATATSCCTSSVTSRRRSTAIARRTARLIEDYRKELVPLVVPSR